MANNKTVIIKIKRQLTPEAKPSWEEFEIAYKPNMNVTSALMEIAARPITRDGKQTTPVAYDSNCLEEICGSCAMLINGRARMACSTLLDHLDQPIKLEPLSKFPIIRDLAVDRSVLFENLKKVKAWVPVDGTYDLGPGPRMTMERSAALMGDGGIQECGYAQNCVEICPKTIPLTTSIADVGGQVMKQALGDLLRK